MASSAQLVWTRARTIINLFGACCLSVGHASQGDPLVQPLAHILTISNCHRRKKCTLELTERMIRAVRAYMLSCSASFKFSVLANRQVSESITSNCEDHQNIEPAELDFCWFCCSLLCSPCPPDIEYDENNELENLGLPACLAIQSVIGRHTLHNQSRIQESRLTRTWQI